MTAPTAAGQPFTCPYCGSSVVPEPPLATVGALVDQLLGEVSPGVHTRPVQAQVHVIGQAFFSVDGQAYASLDQMPADARRALEQELATVEERAQDYPNADIAPPANREDLRDRTKLLVVGVVTGALALVSVLLFLFLVIKG
jgi:hypothetical protein